MTHDQDTIDLSWAPRKSVFVRRVMIVGALTFALFLALGLCISIYFDLPILWVFITGFILTIGFIFDDAMRWRTAQYERWQISEGHLIHEGSEGSARIPLTEIDIAFRRLNSSVIVQLASGQRIVLRYLPYPVQTAEQINAALPK